ncbi:hypothetical protein AYI70_g2757 [Smittium culicis]|uniref:ATPase inhibitor, mitochondrial n=2 Tax=Smittium culicis TaxID=133412 RepID=A0A1R1Y6V5_9FUNG|nr:hypothetical protein AYI70_g7103 [Smittium culicis]OMJ22638.1 hypothetical protein AYI70_g2757 [Smittium culicis]
MFVVSAKNILPLVARSSASAPVAAAALRMYSSTSDGKFGEREKAAEDMYIRKAEAEKIKALHDRIEKAQKEMNAINDALKEIAPKKD